MLNGGSNNNFLNRKGRTVVGIDDHGINICPQCVQADISINDEGSRINDLFHIAVDSSPAGQALALFGLGRLRQGQLCALLYLNGFINLATIIEGHGSGGPYAN